MSAANSIWFMRHGQTNYNLSGLCNADPDVEVYLTDDGIKQLIVCYETDC